MPTSSNATSRERTRGRGEPSGALEAAAVVGYLLGLRAASFYRSLGYEETATLFRKVV
jgi:hypothetical protein